MEDSLFLKTKRTTRAVIRIQYRYRPQCIDSNGSMKNSFLIMVVFITLSIQVLHHYII